MLAALSLALSFVSALTTSAKIVCAKTPVLSLISQVLQLVRWKRFYCTSPNSSFLTLISVLLLCQIPKDLMEFVKHFNIGSTSFPFFPSTERNYSNIYQFQVLLCIKIEFNFKSMFCEMNTPGMLPAELRVLKICTKKFTPCSQ